MARNAVINRNANNTYTGLLYSTTKRCISRALDFHRKDAVLSYCGSKPLALISVITSCVGERSFGDGTFVGVLIFGQIDWRCVCLD